MRDREEEEKDYGINNEKAFSDSCALAPSGDFHRWSFSRSIGNCYREYKCIYCSSIHRIDSSD